MAALGLLLWGCATTGSGAPEPAPASTAPRENPVVVIATELGDIEAELYPDRAPVTVANFLAYVDRGLYRDASFYRAVTLDNDPRQKVKIEVIQGGRDPDAEPDPEELPPIRHETTAETGILHRDGVLSMARLGPGTATSHFFICLGDQPELDYGGRRNPDGQGFAAFGRVVSGMEVVRAIHRRPLRGQSLEPRVRILNITRRDPASDP